MRLSITVIGLLIAAGFACKPASFKSVEDAEEAVTTDPVTGITTADALPETGPAVPDEPIEATEVISTDTKLQVPDPVTSQNPEEVKLVCAAAKANGTLKSKVIAVRFPEKNTSCDYEKNDNLSQKNGEIRARREESVDLPLDGMNRLCNMQLDAPKQRMKFDDEIILTLNNIVIAASQDYSTQSKKKDDVQAYPNGLAIDTDGLVSYKWLPPNGMQNLEYFRGKLTKYCVGLDPKQADFAQNCQIPKTDDRGSMSLVLPQPAFLKLAAKAGLVFDQQIQQMPKARLGLVTTGDNNSSDCQHFDFQMLLTVDYIP